ncbi:uncharacterized protein LOC108098008 [Drosophila ficusphila]|uniref:uncharacterized protein LOC108098008 n=1 Tax=Drosophila ficusphila TaxID=30025 RepID=UPI0007E63CF7|nr:uncharacterized protein LOC108098008 [Drosophila ficusphila]
MHRIPLHMVASPSPEDSEYVTMSKVMCPRNLIESELFLKILQKETDAVFASFSDNAPSCLNISKECMNIKNPVLLMKTLQSLDEIICRAPSGTTTFVDAVLARSVIYMKSNQHSVACNDLLYYESLDPALKTTEGTIVSQILLCICLYMVRKYKESKEKYTYIQDLIEKSLLPDKSEIDLFLTLLNQYDKKINQERRNVEFSKKVRSKTLNPFEGFKMTRKIPYASTACLYFEKSSEKSAGVFASGDIPKGEIVLVENPVYFQFSAPFLNCDKCGIHQELLYTCDICRYKTYCSMSCIKSDAEVHQNECYGYKIGLIPMLESTMLFRLFLESGEYILPALVDFAMDGGVVNNPRDAWIFILEHAQEEDKNYNIVGELLATAPDYKRLTKEKYQEIVTTAFRLSVFIYNDTNLTEKYFYLLTLKKIDMINVIAAILLRLSGHVLSNSQRDELNYLKSHEDMNEAHEELAECDTEPLPADRISANAFNYYGVNAISDFLDCYNSVHNSVDEIENELPEKSSNYSPMCQFADRLHSICIQKYEIETIEDLINAKTLPTNQVDEVLDIFNTSKRCQLLTCVAKYYHQFVHQYFNKVENIFQVKSTLCATLKAFNQNCETENVKVISISTGKRVGVTVKNVVAGEELVVCPEFLKQSDQNITLDLPLCRDLNFPSKTNYGKSTASGLQKSFGNSPEFLRHNKAFTFTIYNKLLAWNQSRKDLKLQLHLSILFGTYNSFLALHCPEKDEKRLLGVLKFSMFLAMNGFLQHASDNVVHVVELIELDDIYFKDIDTYRQIFYVIKRINEEYCKIMIDCQGAVPDFLKMILVSCSLILKRLELHTKALIDNEEASSLFMEYSTYHYKWKAILNSYALIPPGLKNFFADPKKKGKLC